MAPHTAAPASSHTVHSADVLRQFRVVFRAVKQHFQWVERACGVSGSQLWVLATVGRNPGMRVGALAQALSIHQSTASNLLERVEKLGYLKRTRDPEDQRSVRLHLTPAGEAVVAKAPEPLEGVLPNALASLPPELLAQLHDGMRQLIEQMHVSDMKGRDTPLADM